MRLKKFGIGFTAAVFCSLVLLAEISYPIRASSDSSSSVLPISKGGTGSNNASGAAANILGSNFENYSGVLPLTKGGTEIDASSENGKITAQKNLNVPVTFTYPDRTQNSIAWYRVSSVKYDTSSGGSGNQTMLISGLTDWGYGADSYILSTSGRNLTYELISFTTYACHRPAFYIDIGTTRRDFYMKADAWTASTSVTFLSNGDTNPAFSKDILTSIPESAVQFSSKCIQYTS